MSQFTQEESKYMKQCLINIFNENSRILISLSISASSFHQFWSTDLAVGLRIGVVVGRLGGYIGNSEDFEELGEKMRLVMMRTWWGWSRAWSIATNWLQGRSEEVIIPADTDKAWHSDRSDAHPWPVAEHLGARHSDAVWKKKGNSD